MHRVLPTQAMDYAGPALGGLVFVVAMSLLSVVAFGGLRDPRFVGVAWLMHSAWDLVHHFFGNPIWPFMETSSFGCCICDAVIAALFFARAPSVGELFRASSLE